MEKRHKDLLNALVTQLRHALLGTDDGSGQPMRGDLDREIERLGIAPDGAITPLDALPNPTAPERRARRAAEAQLASLPVADRPAARREIVERAGYTWINRLLALRAMEARGLIDEVIRSNLAYGGISEALYILRQTQPGRAVGADGGWWAVVEDACRSQTESLPGLFDLDDPTAALRPSTPALLTCVALVGGSPSGFTVDESDEAFRDPDAIGWAYQFYQEEAKARTYTKLGRGGKVETRAEIAAVTQLFTEPYMVKWLLQNSLGRTYHELYPDSALPETWEYYIRPDELRPPQAEGERGPSSLEELTLMDPCMGSGHFKREGFDMLAAMYRERYPGMGAREIADAVLGHHLHGIDIDPRAAQLAALTLYLRAWELVRDERRAQRLPGAGSYRPPALNLATTPTGLTPGALERHLERHPEDRVFEPLLRGVFAALEQAPILGSLLQPGEHLDEAIRAFQRRAKGQLGLLPEHAALNQLLEELGRHDPVQLRRVLLDRVARSFVVDAGSSGDAAAALFGEEVGEGLRLLQLLERRYAVVATNPPFMRSGSMSSPLKRYVESHYVAGKDDLYAAFMLVCRSLCRSSGRVGIVTQQGWLFLYSFRHLRAAPVDELEQAYAQRGTSGMFRDTSVEAIAHLGPGAFGEISGEVVSVALCTFRNSAAPQTHKATALRAVGLRSPEDKAKHLLRTAETSPRYLVAISDLLEIPNSPLVYWAGDETLDALRDNPKVCSVAEIVEGLGTRWDERFLRTAGELQVTSGSRSPGRLRWFPFVKGGGYRKWTGLQYYAVDWAYTGARILNFRDANGRLLSRPQNIQYYFREGLTYTAMAQGAIGVRRLEADTIAGDAGPIIAPHASADLLAAILNSRYPSFVLRLISPTLQLKTGYVKGVPLPKSIDQPTVSAYARACVGLKKSLVRLDVTERTFDVAYTGHRPGYSSSAMDDGHPFVTSAVLHTLEGILERILIHAYGLGDATLQQLLAETGTPAGWYPLVDGYDDLPQLPPHCDASLVPEDVPCYLAAHARICPDTVERSRIKSSLRALYEAGPGARGEDLESQEPQEDEQDVVSSGSMPIPSETFLEELSQRLQIHPISVFWLLQEMQTEGVRCKPEEQRVLEDRLSVLVLCLLGHRWPRQIEAGDAAPNWADPDGIIPLTPGTSDPTLAERLRERLRAEDGPLGAQQAEALLQELTGQDLETWLQRSFFPRHVRQFKRRPIAWHLTTRPRTGHRRGSRTPAFECSLYYHASTGDALARLRMHYLEPLLYSARGQAQRARQVNNETGAAQAMERIHELEEFSARLRQVEAEGFACPELEQSVQSEPLDRWSGDGVFAPASRAELLAQERAWHVDINDGVRVNVAPLQQAGLLASGVLNASDLRKAVADRARWRSDERRWVRDGVLPRCGWMDESVPESPRWTERAPEREAEHKRLEDRRRALAARLEGSQNIEPEEPGEDQIPGPGGG